MPLPITMSLAKQTDVIRELLVSQLLFEGNSEAQGIKGGDHLSEEMKWRPLQCNKVKPLHGLYCNYGITSKTPLHVRFASSM